MKNKIKNILLLLIPLFLVDCANVVAPTGGPKDIIPPKVVDAIPQNNSILFIGKKIELTFDEYVNLENANQNVLISPPLQNKPDIKLSNKTLVIRFKEILKPNTTYTIDLGSAVKDLHEGNLLTNYHYTFSTGETLDSLTLSGTVLDAETKKPVEELFVSLYRGESDSLYDQPTRRAPDFISRTDKEGKFQFRGLPEGQYLVFALKDVNSNLYYDMPNEMVAFLDTLLSLPVFHLSEEIDTLMELDSLGMIPPAETDTLIELDSLGMIPPSEIDTLIELDSLGMIPPAEIDTLMELDSVGVPRKVKKLLVAPHVVLYAFTEVDTNQMVLEKKLIGDGILRFVFRHPAQNVTVEAPQDSLLLMNKVWSPDRDTLWWYFTPGILDTLRVNLHYDTLINETSLLNLHYRETKPTASKALKVSSNINKGVLLPGEDLLLRFAEPVSRVHWHDSSALVVNDSLVIDTLRFAQADEHGLQYRLLNALDDSAHYSLRLTDSVFFSVTGRTHDSLTLNFRRAGDHDLGNVFVTVEPPEGRQVVVQLLNAAGKVLRSQVTDTLRRVEFPHLFPEKYQLRAVIDTDRNGKWSTGNYHLRFLPEAVIDYKDPLEVKAGWDIDIDEIWVISH